MNNMSLDIKCFKFVENILSQKETDFSPATDLDFPQKEAERGKVFLGTKRRHFQGEHA